MACLLSAKNWYLSSDLADMMKHRHRTTSSIDATQRRSGPASQVTKQPARHLGHVLCCAIQRAFKATTPPSCINMSPIAIEATSARPDVKSETGVLLPPKQAQDRLRKAGIDFESRYIHMCC
jgi:hypothetical protein